jgi:hypothetical protein
MNPPSNARPVSGHPLALPPAAGMSQKNGIVTAHAQSTDLPTLANI